VHGIKVNSIRNFILGVTAASLILGIILLILLSYANSKPIIELMKTLLDFFKNEDDNKKDEFHFLKTSVSALIHQSSTMKSDIQKQRTTLQKSVIERLLLGKNINSGVLERALQSGIDLNAKAYLCVLVSMNNAYTGNDYLQEIDMEQIIHTQITGPKGYLIDMDQTTLCLLLCFNTQEADKCKQHTETVISWLQNRILQSCNFTPTFAIGSIYHGLRDIYLSFNEAKQTLAFTPVPTPSTMIWYSNLEMNKRSSYFYLPNWNNA
jgi:sugar diacid utilization regulator